MVYNTTTLAVSLMAKSCELQINNISDGLIAYPQNARHHFMVRLLNRMLSNYGVKIYSQSKPSAQNRFAQSVDTECLTLSRATVEDGVLKAKNSLFAVASTKLDSDIDPDFGDAQVQIIVDELLEIAMNKSSVTEEVLPFRVILKDGMIIVREHTLSHIIGIASSLNIPNGTYIENIISTIYIAKSLHVSIDEIRSAISDLCFQSMAMEMIAEKHGIRYFDNSNVVSHSECIEILTCFGSDKVVILGGPSFVMTAQLEDALVDSNADIVVLPNTNNDYVKGLHERLANVYDDRIELAEIIHEAESLLPDGGALL